MKNTAFIFALVGLLTTSTGLFAQEDAKARTLFSSSGDGFDKAGFFVAPAIAFTSMDESAASLFNVRAGISLTDRFSLGAYFNTSLNQIQPVSETQSGVYLDYWSTGALLEYTLWSRNLVHLTFPLNIGYGEVEMDNEAGEANLGEANFFQIEPSVLLEVNLHKYIRLNLGTGYRWVGEMTYRGFDQDAITGFTAYAGIKAGLFK